MGVYMRSNDVIFGFCNDIFTFSLFHQLMFHDLREHYPNLKLGRYSHNAGSMHIYERHYDMAERIMKDGAKYYSIESSKIKLNSDVTSEYILMNGFYLNKNDMTKDEIINTSKDLKKVLIQEVING
jgi:thymidylate synthase